MTTQRTNSGHRRALPLPLAGTMILALMTGCSESPNDPGNPGQTPAEVGQYLVELPSWSTYTADVNGPDQAPTPAGPPESVGADEIVRVRVQPSWLRLDARYGSVYRRRGDAALVLN